MFTVANYNVVPMNLSYGLIFMLQVIFRTLLLPWSSMPKRDFSVRAKDPRPESERATSGRVIGVKSRRVSVTMMRTDP